MTHARSQAAVAGGLAKTDVVKMLARVLKVRK
jgi:hypothetical protein